MQLERQASFYRTMEEEYRKTKKWLLEISEALRKHEAVLSLPPPNDKDQEDVGKIHVRLTTLLELLSNARQNILKQLNDAQAAKGNLENVVNTKNQEIHALQLRVNELHGSVTAFQMALSDRPLPDKISLSDFTHGDLALFVRNEQQGFFEAFNNRCPNYYLSEYSILSLLGSQKNPNNPPPTMVYGQIVEMDSGRADNGHNPYKLAAGTEYHVVTISRV